MCDTSNPYEDVQRQIKVNDARTAAAAVNPLNRPTPDSGDAVSARLQAKQRLQMLAGYRATFLTGPRGPGGPSPADQSAQLTPPGSGEGPGSGITVPKWLPPPEVPDTPTSPQTDTDASVIFPPVLPPVIGFPKFPKGSAK